MSYVQNGLSNDPKIILHSVTKFIKECTLEFDVINFLGFFGAKIHILTIFKGPDIFLEWHLFGNLVPLCSGPKFIKECTLKFDVIFCFSDFQGAKMLIFWLQFYKFKHFLAQTFLVVLTTLFARSL